jgi:elongation factor Ts
VSITATDVKALRDRTGAGMMECKKALEEAGGDTEKAIDLLRVKGQAQAAKRGERQAAQGTVAHYAHFNGQVGALVEVNCEIAVHVASAAPHWVSEEDVPEDERARELTVFEQQADDSKPPEVRKKIAEGRMRKWLEEVVLLNQKHVNADRYDGRTIEQLRAEISAKTGENVVIRRFARFRVGE